MIDRAEHGCGDDEGEDGTSSGSGASGTGASGTGASGTGASGTGGAGASGTGASGGAGGGSVACNWDVPEDMAGTLFPLAGGDMGLDHYTSAGAAGRQGGYRIPCDGGPLEPLGNAAAFGKIERVMPDGRLFASNGYIDPVTAAVEPLPDCTGACAFNLVNRFVDDADHVYDYFSSVELVELDPAGNVVSQVPADGLPIASLSDGVVTFKGPAEVSCWTPGIENGPALAADAPDLSMQQNGSSIDILSYAEPRGGNFLMNLYDRPSNTSMTLRFYSMSCAGVNWTIEADWIFPGGNVVAIADGLSSIWWTESGDALLLANLEYGEWSLEGTVGNHFVGVFDGDTGAQVFMESWTRDEGSAAAVAPGPNGTVWVATQETGVSVLDAQGNLMLGQPLP